MRNGKFDAMVPVTKQDRELVHRLGKLIGRSLGGSGFAAGLAIDWAIANSRSPDPSFRPTTNGGNILQLHLSLDKDYRMQGYEPIQVGSLMSQGIAHFFGRFSDAFRRTPGIGGLDKVWFEKHEVSVVREFYREAFAEGRDPAQTFLEKWKAAVRSLLEEIPAMPGRVPVDLWTDPEARALYDELEGRLSILDIDVDSAVAARLAVAARRPLG